ncbi:hypothetical protein [Agrococcus jejuensis]|uniref:Gram-positive cocci surface proteins LPxTG domain-containing protein n=1 Tax=Agrococcus jejuensis TaxID=399736 RepID=A0A1G8CSG8_9MICO|nr:hypothetical protein [Agrococcus jejuensis]SDH48435.1 hypothetical protein SAMN04489720_1396 [Agrococcus jejuensis]
MPRPTLRARTRRLALAAVATAGALLLPITALVVAAPAMAGGSDAPTPYTVSASGVTLPDGQTFRANGHVNAQVIPVSQYTPGETYRARGADWTPMQITRHFDPNNGQPGGAYIGQSYYPFSGAQQQLPADGYCVIWVQVDGFDEHFGEGGQDPICTTTPVDEEPTPSEPAPSEPAPSEPAVVHPEIQDYVGACDAAFVLDNGSSTVDVTYTINGVDYLVPARSGIHTDADGTRIAPVDGKYVITTDTGRSWTFPARECVVSPQIQDYVGACDAAFVLDNGSSTVDVTYTINGVDYLVPARSGIHTDADGTRIAPVDGKYVITTDTGRSWTFPARTCPASTPPVSPAPSEPTPSEPTPSEPAPSEPAPSEPTPSQPTPSDPTPSEPTPSEPTPSQPTPSEPAPSEPTPSQPTPSEPGVDVPAVDPPTEPVPPTEPPATDQPTPSEESPATDVPAVDAGEVPTEVGTPAASEQPVAATPTAAAVQPATAVAVAQEATLPRTGGEPLLLVMLVGGLLVALGAAVRVARR